MVETTGRWYVPPTVRSRLPRAATTADLNEWQTQRLDELWEAVRSLRAALAAAGIPFPQQPASPVLVGRNEDDGGDWVPGLA